MQLVTPLSFYSDMFYTRTVAMQLTRGIYRIMVAAYTRDIQDYGYMEGNYKNIFQDSSSSLLLVAIM